MKQVTFTLNVSKKRFCYYDIILQIQNTKYKIQNTKYKIQNTKYKIQNQDE